MQALTKPRYFMPIHGESRHLAANRELALEMGIPDRNIFISEIGKVLEIDSRGARYVGTVPAGQILIDGYGIGDVGNVVLRDRRHLAQDGLIVVVATVDLYDKQLLSGPDIVSRGFVYVRESETLLDEVRKLALDILEDCAEKNIHEWGIIKNRIKDEISKLIAQRTRRAPMILPILQEV